jgi:amino acid efflux transporter
MTVLQDSTTRHLGDHARSMATASTKPLSFSRGTALYAAAVLGPGILTLPALAANVAGPAFLLPLVAILVLSGLLAATFTALGRRDGATSSLAVHVKSAFGPAAGRVVGMLFYIGVPPGVAALGLFAGQYLQAATGGTHTPWLTALVLIAVTYRLNTAGLRASATAQLALTSVLVLLLVVTVLLSVSHVDGTRFTPFAPHGWAATGPAAFLLVWVLTGWEASANLFGALDPSVVARVAATAVAIIAAAFLGISTVVVGVLGAEDNSPAPVAHLLEIAIGPVGLTVAAGLAVVLTLGTMNAYVSSLGALGRGLAPQLAAGRAAAPFWIPTAIAVAALAATLGRPHAAAELVGVTAASQVPVLFASTLAALRLLPRRSGSWWAALGASVAVGPLLVPAGGYLVAPAAIALGTLAIGAVRGRLSRNVGATSELVPPPTRLGRRARRRGRPTPGCGPWHPLARPPGSRQVGASCGSSKGARSVHHGASS